MEGNRIVDLSFAVVNYFVAFQNLQAGVKIFDLSQFIDNKCYNFEQPCLHDYQIFVVKKINTMILVVFSEVYNSNTQDQFVIMSKRLPKKRYLSIKEICLKLANDQDDSEITFKGVLDPNSSDVSNVASNETEKIEHESAIENPSLGKRKCTQKDLKYSSSSEVLDNIEDPQVLEYEKNGISLEDDSDVDQNFNFPGNT